MATLRLATDSELNAQSLPPPPAVFQAYCAAADTALQKLLGTDEDGQPLAGTIRLLSRYTIHDGTGAHFNSVFPDLQVSIVVNREGWLVRLQVSTGGRGGLSVDLLANWYINDGELTAYRGVDVDTVGAILLARFRQSFQPSR